MMPSFVSACSARSEATTVMSNFEKIFNDTAPEILAARAKAAEQWGGPDHDATHTGNDWMAILVKHVGKCLDSDKATFRKQMVKVIAISLDALAASDGWPDD
jgi:hypothetical protein